MIPKEIRTKYLDKSGDEFICITNLVENEHGFASYFLEPHVLVVVNVCGDVKHWDKFFSNMAKENNCKKIRFVTRRSPEAWGRLIGFELVGYILEREVK